MNTQIKTTIKDMRLRAGWTQKQLADLLCVDAITVSRWERGKQVPSPLALREIEKLIQKK